MMSGSLAVFLLGLFCAAVTADPRQGTADTLCTAVHVKLDPSLWHNYTAGTFLGEAVGQSFRAEDTVITKLTVWRPPNRPNVLGVHLFITAVDTTLTPPLPDTHAILLDGPTLHVYDSDPPGDFVELAFVIDPPLHLSHPGIYAFFLQTEDCNQGEFDIIGSDQNPYPYGIAWQTGRVSYPCYLRGVAGGGDNYDLLFDIEFCRPDQVTPVLKRSWGQIKSIYR